MLRSFKSSRYWRLRELFKALAPLLAAFAVCLVPMTSRAIVVLKRGSQQPIMGYLVREDETGIVVRELLAGGRTREQRIERAEIEELLVTVDPDRLAALNPSEPRRYLEYAEELAEKSRDPEARDAALRLYHIAAWLAEGPVRQSSLLGLAAMADIPDERRRLEAAAYLHDPAQNRVVLATSAEDSRPIVEPSLQPEVLSAIRLLRQGKPRNAEEIAKNPAVVTALNGLAPTINAQQFTALCQLKTLTREHMRRLLSVEVALLRSAAGARIEPQWGAKQAGTSWGQIASQGDLAPLPSLDLLHLTTNDPRASVFREGKWTIP
jgi:hypothetical protein